MGIFDSIRRRSSPVKETSSVRPTRSRTTTTTSTGYSSRYSSAPTSRCPSPISPTRSDELSSIISRSIHYPNPTPGEFDSNLSRIKSNLSTKLKHLHTKQNQEGHSPEERKSGDAPAGFRSFVQNAKNQNPNYRQEKLRIMKPVSSKDGFGWLMDRKRNDWVDE
ncbi:hypothetical protein V866_002975 [Kwoniella sp. B9012]